MRLLNEVSYLLADGGPLLDCASPRARPRPMTAATNSRAVRDFAIFIFILVVGMVTRAIPYGTDEVGIASRMLSMASTTSAYSALRIRIADSGTPISRSCSIMST